MTIKHHAYSKERDAIHHSNQSYAFKVSVIIPIYNTEQYLEETILSIIEQSMDMNDIEIILINDGSTDKSEEICNYYQRIFPRNIKYIYKENGGVSVARNLGLKLAKGKYINFLDSDDKWGLLTFEKVYTLLETHPEADIASAHLKFFDNMSGEHPLNYKYHETEHRIVDLSVDYDNIQMHVSSAFFRASAVKGLIFDTELKYAEDSKFVYHVIKNNSNIALMSKVEGCYWYRKRKDESSAIDTAHRKKTFYMPTLTRFHEEILFDNVDVLSKYKQMVIMYDMQYRINFSPVTLATLTDAELEEYRNKIIKILKVIDDEIIQSERLKHINAVFQVAILAAKYEGVHLEIHKENGIYNLYSNGIFIKNLSDMYLKTEYAYIKSNILKLGYSLPNINMKVDIKPILIINQHKSVQPTNENIITKQMFLNENISFNKFYRFDVDINEDIKRIEVKYLINNSEIIEINQVSKTLKTNFSNTRIPFKQLENKTVRLIQNKRFYFKRKTNRYVIKNLIGLFSNKKTIKSAIYKTYGLLMKKKTNKPIWLFTDRIHQAGDNAEALFSFVANHKRDIQPYFLIQSGTRDYYRLQKRYGNMIVEWHSLKHHKLILKASKILSSHSEDYIVNPFGMINGQYIRELLDAEVTFLQHGITQNDLSTFLHKKNKPMDNIIVSSSLEKDSFLKDYGYIEDELPLTGLARFDLLQRDNTSKKKIITIMPTWRPHLLSDLEIDFTETTYYQQISNYLKDDRITKLLYEENVEIHFCQHPKMKEKFDEYFKSIPGITIKEQTNYKEIISKTDLLITDVSSIAFDVAYLNKPIIYFHFDIDEIYKYSVYERGYFSYEKMGFGPIAYDAEGLVARTLEIQGNQFANISQNTNRINIFFAHLDEKNCERIYEEIKN